MARVAEAAEGRSFRPLFERWSRRVRVELALRHVASGAALGLLLGAGASLALWQTRHGALRPVGVASSLEMGGAGTAPSSAPGVGATNATGGVGGPSSSSTAGAV